jgi:hypothetical protein
MSQSGEVFYYTVCDAKGKDVGGRYKGYSPSAAAAKAAKSEHVFPDRKDYPTPKTFYIRRMDGKRIEPTIYCYKATQKMVKATAFIKEQSGNDKMRSVSVEPCKM